MPKARLTWQEELAIIDRTMKAISSVTDPEELVDIYWTGIGELIEVGDFVALSRRNVDPPYFLITRSSRFAEQLNPWTQRERLPKLTGGLLGEIAYANQPVFIDDLPSRLQPDDPARFYIEGFQSLVALPVYDGGEGLNVTVMLIPPGMEIERARIPMMHWQAGLFGRGTTNQVLRNQLGAVLAELDRELKVVGDIQRSLLPSTLPSIPGLEMAAHYQTSSRAGGDYYDFFPLANGGWGLFIADVSGHGTPAAVLMAVTHAIAHAQPGTHAPPSALLNYLNSQLARAYTREGTFVTAFYAVFDPIEKTLTYSVAGHNPPRLMRDGQVSPLDKNGAIPLGILDGQTYEQSSLSLKCGDVLILYTDGITEAMTAPQSDTDRREMFGVERLDALILEHGHTGAQSCVNAICSAVASFTGNVATDDQTLIAIRCV